MRCRKIDGVFPATAATVGGESAKKRVFPRISLTVVGPGRSFTCEGHEGPGRTDTRLAGKVQNPRRGEVLRGEPRGSPRSRLRRARNGRRFAADPLQAQGRRLRKTRSRRGGRKTPGGDEIPREDRATPAGFGRGGGNGLPRSARPGRRARTQGGSGRRVRSSQRQAGRPAGRRRPCRGRGNLRREESHERYRLKHGGRVPGGRKRQEGGKPWRRSVTG